MVKKSLITMSSSTERLLKFVTRNRDALGCLPQGKDFSSSERRGYVSGEEPHFMAHSKLVMETSLVIGT